LATGTEPESVSPAPTGDGPRAIQAVPVRHPWRWAIGLLILLLAANAIWSIATVAEIKWDTVGEYIFLPQIFRDLGWTLLLTVIAMVMGILLGVVLAVMWLSPNPLASGASWFYIWVFRGTPVLVQIIFWGFLGAVYDQLTVGVPFGGPTFFGGETNVLITPFMAAIFGLGFNEAAYMAEIVRAGSRRCVGSCCRRRCE
jgi:polar amino acid transport system permease protein